MRYQIDQIVLDTDRFELTRDGKLLHAEPKVIELIVLLVENRERMVPREEILRTVWHDRVVSESALSSCVKEARKLFDDDGRKQYFIRTIHKKGFRFVAAINSTSGKEPHAPMQVEPDARRNQSKPSIAVLPFSNSSGDPEQDSFCDGVT
ncbi:MAG: CadC-family transcriptional regulator, partial [Gammaproteobacteria bacterium]